MSPTPWTDTENDLTVADYFAMLAKDLAVQPYKKAEHNRQLQAQIGRARTAIEFKHQNISAILKGLNEVWITGYKPAGNFQRSLEMAVIGWLNAHPERFLPTPGRVMAAGLHERPSLYVGPAPTMSNQPPPQDLEQVLRLAHKHDAAGRDERNRALGRAGESLVLAHERATLMAAGRPDLAARLRWVSQEDGDGAGYDIASFTPDGKARLIEVKTTNGWERSPFHISRNELEVADQLRDEWCLLRLWNFARAPKAFELRPPLDAHVTLTATSFQASFN